MLAIKFAYAAPIIPKYGTALKDTIKFVKTPVTIDIE
jgi:dUTPase